MWPWPSYSSFIKGESGARSHQSFQWKDDQSQEGMRPTQVWRVSQSHPRTFWTSSVNIQCINFQQGAGQPERKAPAVGSKRTSQEGETPGRVLWAEDDIRPDSLMGEQGVGKSTVCNGSPAT